MIFLVLVHTVPWPYCTMSNPCTSCVRSAGVTISNHYPCWKKDRILDADFDNKLSVSHRAGLLSIMTLLHYFSSIDQIRKKHLYYWKGMKIDGDHEFENILFKIILISLTVASAFGSVSVFWARAGSKFYNSAPVQYFDEKYFCRLFEVPAR